jgi:hypothetical protein
VAVQVAASEQGEGFRSGTVWVQGTPSERGEGFRSGCGSGGGFSCRIRPSSHGPATPIPPRMPHRLAVGVLRRRWLEAPKRELGVLPTTGRGVPDRQICDVERYPRFHREWRRTRDQRDGTDVGSVPERMPEPRADQRVPPPSRGSTRGLTPALGRECRRYVRPGSAHGSRAPRRSRGCNPPLQRRVPVRPSWWSVGPSWSSVWRLLLSRALQVVRSRDSA